MKRLIQKLMFAFIQVCGWFIGLMKGHQARHKWVNRKMTRKEGRRMKFAIDEVVLDDFELQSFHRN